MARQGYSLLGILLLLGSLTGSIATTESYSTATLNRASFPKDFFFGAASSSYQYEGAANEGGRGPSIWDTFTHKRPDKIVDHSNGDVAADFYHRYKEDIGIMKDMGIDAHRFSISWPRILPNGKLSGGVNREAVTHYNNFINQLLANNITPWVTIFHWDLPQALEDEYGGFLSPKIVDHFRDYAEVCFKKFGDRVKYWMTLNEPWTFSEGGYASGSLAPSHCSDWQNFNCTTGDSGTEPYIVAHNQLLAHAAAVNLYREKYQATQKGLIGIPLTSHWFLPYSDTKQDKIAAQRALDFMFGWFMDPLTSGDYPQSMRHLLQEKLPRFSAEQSQMVKGSFDFIGLNYYTTNYAAHIPDSTALKRCYLTDSRTNRTTERNGILIGPKASARWLHVYPEGFEDLLLYTKRTYNNPLIYITENGVDDIDTSNLTLEEALADGRRIDYLYRHLYFLRRAMEKGANVKGYIAWSLLDNFEWPSGYTARFGLNYVDFKNGLQRYPKSSAKWFKSFLKIKNWYMEIGIQIKILTKKHNFVQVRVLFSLFPYSFDPEIAPRKSKAKGLGLPKRDFCLGFWLLPVLKSPPLKARRAGFASISKNRSPELKRVFLGTQRERDIRFLWLLLRKKLVGIFRISSACSKCYITVKQW